MRVKVDYTHTRSMIFKQSSFFLFFLCTCILIMASHHDFIIKRLYFIQLQNKSNKRLGLNLYNNTATVQNVWFAGLKVITCFSCSTQLIMKFVLLINLKLPSAANSFLLNIAEYENFSANKYENYC